MVHESLKAVRGIQMRDFERAYRRPAKSKAIRYDAINIRGGAIAFADQMHGFGHERVLKAVQQKALDLFVEG